MTTYTIINHNSGEVEQRGVSLRDAAIELLTHDGYEYDIRPADCGHALWTSRASRNSTRFSYNFTRSVIYSIKTERAEAEAEIFQRVIDSGHWTRPDVMTDDAYDRDMAEQASEEATL